MAVCLLSNKFVSFLKNCLADRFHNIVLLHNIALAGPAELGAAFAPSVVVEKGYWNAGLIAAEVVMDVELGVEGSSCGCGAVTE